MAVSGRFAVPQSSHLQSHAVGSRAVSGNCRAEIRRPKALVAENYSNEMRGMSQWRSGCLRNDSPDEFVVLYHCGYSDSNAVFKAAYNYLGAAGITCETFSLVVLPKKMTMTAGLAPVGSFVSTVLNSK